MKKIIILLFIIIFSASGCKSFKRVNIEGQPDECKDFYLVMEYYSVQGGDSAFVGTVYEKCVQARKDKDKAEIKDLKKWGNDMCDKLYKEDINEYKKCVK